MSRSEADNFYFQNSLYIISVNVNSIIKNERRASLLNLLDTRHPDIVLLSETKLNGKHVLEFQNYEVHRRDRPNSQQGGGTAVLVKKPMKFKVIKNGQINNFKCLEVSIIEFKISCSQKLIVISAYAPKVNDSGLFQEEFGKLFKILELEKDQNFYILAGDLNARHRRWKNNESNTRGNQLNRWFEEGKVLFRANLLSTDMPSFPRGNSYLDICIVDARLNIGHFNGNNINCLPTIPYDSDHYAVCIEASLDDTPFRLITKEDIPKLNYRYTDWSKFKAEFEKHFNENLENLSVANNINLTNREIEAYLTHLNEAMLKMIDKTVPKIKSKDSVKCYLNKTIAKLQKMKSKILTQIKTIYRRFQNFNNQYLIRLKSILRNINKLIKDNFRLSINKYWEDKIRSIRSNESNMFPMINKIFRNKEKTKIETVKISSEDVNIITRAQIDPATLRINEQNFYVIDEDENKLDIIGAVFEKIYTVNSVRNPNLSLDHEIVSNANQFRLETDDSHDRNETVTTFNDDKTSNELTLDETDEYFITFGELVDIFRRLNNKKSSGNDGIPNIVLKHLPDVIIRQYCALFNNALNNTYFPQTWKTAITYPIPKKGKDTSNPSNLRSINLLPNISKVFEVVINMRLVKFCEDKCIIPENQFGFKRQHSTVHAINKLVSDVHWNFNKNYCTGALLIDFEKAFDTVWIDGLIFKLIRFRLPTHLIRIISDMISDKKFIVTDGINKSKLQFKVWNGLQQGMVNSPILFNIFTSDLATNLENSISYADDLIIYKFGNKVEEIKRHLQNDFDKVQNYCNDWKLKINVNKCEVILFRPPLSKVSRNIRKNWKNLQIMQNSTGEIIEQKLSVKYLGVILDQYLYYNEHVKTQLEKAKNSFNKIRRLFFSKYLDKKVKIISYKTLVRPIILYGCPIWFNISPGYMEKIRVFERHCLRACLRLYRNLNSNNLHYISNKKLYDTAKINRIDIFIIKQIRNHFVRASHSENSLIRGPTCPCPEYHSRAINSGFLPPESFIYLDSKGMVQDTFGVPVLYHIYRNSSNKKIEYPPHTLSTDIGISLRFDFKISSKDIQDFYLVRNNKFWWIENERQN